MYYCNLMRSRIAHIINVQLVAKRQKLVLRSAHSRFGSQRVPHSTQ